MRGKTMHLVVAVVALGLLVALATVAVGQGEDSPPGEGVAQVTSVEPEAGEAVSTLEEPRTAGDEMPAEVAEAFDAEADFGMNPDLSQRAIGNTTNSVFLIPADDHVCVSLTVGEGAVIACPATDAVAEGTTGPGTVLLDGGSIAIYGIVPDGVESVTVETGETTSTPVEVIDNAYYEVVSAGTVLRTLSYTGPSGAVEHPLRDPSLPSEE